MVAYLVAFLVARLVNAYRVEDDLKHEVNERIALALTIKPLHMA